MALGAVELYDLNRLHPVVGHRSLENLPKKRLRALPSFHGVFGEAFKPVPSWPFELEG